MFSSQKKSTLLQERVTPIGAAILNTSCIIFSGLLPQAADSTWTVPAVTKAVS
jgi:hypothetical protein